LRIATIFIIRVRSIARQAAVRGDRAVHPQRRRHCTVN
jgi:hypothetical protein